MSKALEQLELYIESLPTALAQGQAKRTLERVLKLKSGDAPPLYEYIYNQISNKGSKLGENDKGDVVLYKKDPNKGLVLKKIATGYAEFLTQTYNGKPSNEVNPIKGVLLDEVLSERNFGSMQALKEYVTLAREDLSNVNKVVVVYFKRTGKVDLYDDTTIHQIDSKEHIIVCDFLHLILDSSSGGIGVSEDNIKSLRRILQRNFETLLKSKLG